MEDEHAEWPFPEQDAPAQSVDPDLKAKVYAVRIAALTLTLMILTFFLAIWKWIF